MYPGCVVEETDAREHVWKSRVQNKGQLQRKPLTCVGRRDSFRPNDYI